jgi:hypothetical protein
MQNDEVYACTRRRNELQLLTTAYSLSDDRNARKKFAVHRLSSSRAVIFILAATGLNWARRKPVFRYRTDNIRFCSGIGLFPVDHYCLYIA